MYTPQYYDQVLNLVAARVDFRIEMLGNFVYIRAGSSPLAWIDIKLNSPANRAIRLTRHTGIVCKFDSLYVSNLAQNETIQIFISEDLSRLRYIETKSDVNIIDEEPTQLLVLHTDCPLAATEYEANFLLTHVKGFMLKARGGDFQWCWVTGQTNINFILLEDGHSFEIDGISMITFDLFFETNVAGAILEIILKI